VHKAFAVLFFLLFAMPSWAQQIKIGLIDIQKAIGDSQQGKKAKEKFQAQVKKIEADLMRQKQELEKMKADIDKKGPLLKDDDRRRLEGDMQKKYIVYQRDMQENQEELQQKEREMTSDILKELMGVIVEVGKNEKFTMILERSQLLYSDQAIDITTKVVDLYNGRSGGGTAAAKPPAKGK
jgi:outer membrane protein